MNPLSAQQQTEGEKHEVGIESDSGISTDQSEPCACHPASGDRKARQAVHQGDVLAVQAGIAGEQEAYMPNSLDWEETLSAVVFIIIVVALLFT